jgi:hypothetical protein
MGKTKLYTIGLIVAIIALCVLIYISWGNKISTVKKPYYAVYLQTGDMYFGKLSRFPKLTLSDVWLLQVSTQEDQTGFNLAKFSNVVFGPEDKMEINKENVVWISKLRDDSQVVNYIQQSKNAALPNTQPQASVPQTTLPASEE